MTRRLIKEGEFAGLSSGDLNVDVELLLSGNPAAIALAKSKILCIYKRNGFKLRKKWRVGQSHAVCVSTGKGRAKKAVWYCSDCKNYLAPPKEFFVGRCKDEKTECLGLAGKCRGFYNPLCIRITAIRKEKLLDISESDVLREGFKTKAEFVEYVYNLYGKKVEWMPTDEQLPKAKLIQPGIVQGAVADWNPDVWILTMEVIK